MASVNKVILVGNLGRDPEIRSFSNGDRVANVNLATTETWKDKASGERREATEWHRLVFNGRLVDIVEQYLRKGSQIYVEGSIRSRKWQDKESGQERQTTEIRVDQMTMLGGRPNAGGAGSDEGGDDWGARRGQPVQRAGGQAPAGAPGAGGGAGGRPPAKSGSGFDDLHDDIPF